MIKEERYIGSLLGAAIGDALGWPNEQRSNAVKKIKGVNEYFVDWTKNSGGRFWPHEEKICYGEYSDDTQLLVSTLRSLLKRQQWATFFRKAEIPAWLAYERGGGGATKRAARSWEKGKSPWDTHNGIKDIKSYFMAGGNGVAMRILPHVFLNEEDTDKILKQVVLNGMYTHGHPRALVGATLYACGVQYLLKREGTLKYGELIDYLLENQIVWGTLPSVSNLESWLKCSKDVMKIDYYELWNEIVKETSEYLRIAKEGIEKGVLDIGSKTLEKLGCFNKKINGAGNITAVASFYLFSKYASTPKAGVVEAANLENTDTDTLASMTGGLLGALHGESWIPLEWRSLQDYNMFSILVNKLVEGQDDLVQTGMDYKLFNKNILATFKVGEIQTLLPFGEMQLMEIRKEKSRSDSICVETYIFKTNYGQTVFAKKLSKYVNYVPSESLTNESHLFNIEIDKNTMLKVKNISEILSQVDKTKDFVEIISKLIDNKVKKKYIPDEEIDFIIKSYPQYNLTRDQIIKTCKIFEK